jgi:ABC-2 type transport system permease protein
LKRLRRITGRVFAFMLRDAQLALSYRMNFLLSVISILLILTTLYFIAQLFAGHVGVADAQWRDPLAAWITGLAVLNYFMTSFSSLANAIRAEQAQGTLESVLLTPIGIPTLIVSSSAWDFVQATFYSTLYLFFGWLFFGVTYRGNYLLALLILLLTTLVLASLGILSASFAIVFKRGDPFGAFLGISSAIFSGIFFPAQMLPARFRLVSRFLPVTYGLDAIRRVLIQGQGWADIYPPVATLVIFFGVLFPLSLWVFARAVRRAKREGSLIQY